MGLNTKINLSGNRQHVLPILTEHQLSGSTIMGVNYSDLPSGVDPSNSGVTETITGVTTTFSGNSSAVTFVFGDPRMEIAEYKLTPITNATSGTSQNVGNVFVGNNSGSTDGNIWYTDYSGVSYTLVVTSIEEVSAGNFTGTTNTEELDILSGGSLDYTSRLIWATVKGFLLSDDIIISGLTNATSLATDADGKIIDGASDARLKTNVYDIGDALSKVKSLRPVSFNWVPEANMGGATIFGLIAQEVQEVIPDLVKKRAKGDNMLNVDYIGLIPWIIRAIGELSDPDYTGTTSTHNKKVYTETVVAEDNNIELNYGGTHISSDNGGIIVKHGLGDELDANFTLSGNCWTSNTPIVSPVEVYTPTSSADAYGVVNQLAIDDEYMYIKKVSGWERWKTNKF